ncbi:MAG: glycosyltransferase family protein [Thermoanaerobaculia bacterium]
MGRVLLVCGSLNQTTMMHKVGTELSRRHGCFYSPFFADPPLRYLKPLGMLDHTILGGRFRRVTEDYLHGHGLPVDDGGRRGPYDLALTCSDLIVPKVLRRQPLVLVQEGMTDPENVVFHLVKALGLPRWLASTSTTGLSCAYDRFCVASEGYRAFFERKGVPADRLVVTGIPNYDDCASFLENDFPRRGYVLVATSDARETFKRDDRKRFIESAREIAAGRPLVWKLHPNEDWERATREIEECAPGSTVYTEGNTNHMIANCDVLITQWSTVVYVGLALGKECHSYFHLDDLRPLAPLQNGGRSAASIAAVCEELLSEGRGRERRAA